MFFAGNEFGSELQLIYCYKNYLRKIIYNTPAVN